MFIHYKQVSWLLETNININKGTLIYTPSKGWDYYFTTTQLLPEGAPLVDYKYNIRLLHYIPVLHLRYRLFKYTTHCYKESLEYSDQHVLCKQRVF